MSQQLIDSLAADVTIGFDRAFQLGISCEVPIAEAVLRSPELQQIRSTLKRMAMQIYRHSPDSVLVNFGLSDHVIEWVLS